MSGDRDPESLQGLIQHRYVDIPDDGEASLRLHVVEAGVGPLVVLLHGFPEAWFSWQHQIPALVGAGYRVLTPDMRGYNLSDKPKGLDAYRIERLVSDVAGLIHWAGAAKATVIGHDWGANVAWNFAMRRPELLERLAILNVPHPLAMARGLQRPAQLVKSAYMFFFQLPSLPERLFLARDAMLLRRTLKTDPVRPGAFAADDIDRYVAAAQQPGAVTGGMNYYRALFRRAKGQMRIEPIAAPVLVIWGEQDRYLGKELAQPPPRLVPNARVERLPDASHWVQNDRPERVNQLLLDFLKQA